MRAKLQAIINQLEAKKVTVGFHSSARYPNGTPVALVAAVHELGYSVPVRPFFRNAIAKNSTNWALAQSKLIQAAVKEKLTVEQALGQLGEMVVGGIKESIIDGEYTPLSDATLKARQYKKTTEGVATKPLIDTGHMLNSVDYEVSDV